MRTARHTKMIAAIVGAAGIAMSASAQQAVTKSSSKSSTTISVHNDEGVYEIRIEDGKLKTVKVDGEKIDPKNCELDQEAGFIVISPEGEEPFVLDIPSISSGFGVTAPLAIARGHALPPAVADMPEIPAVPDVIEWADEPAGQQQAWGIAAEPPRVMIGITHDEVDADHREMFKLNKGEGIYVIDVREGLPAAKAGIKAGDVIIEVDGERIEKREILREVLDDSDPGDNLRVVVIREGKDGDVIKKRLKLKLAEYDGAALRGGDAVARAWTVKPEGKARFRINAEGNGFELDEDFPFAQNFVFPDGEEIEFFNEFDFEFPEHLEGVEPEVREEIERALKMARERAHDTQARALELRINKNRAGEWQSQMREMQSQARKLQNQARDMQSRARQIQREDSDDEHAQEMQERAREMQERAREMQHHARALQEMGEDHEHELHELHEHLAELHEHGLHFEEHSFDDLEELREHGLDIQILMDGELKRLHELGLKLDKLGTNEQIIRSAPGGRAFIIERERDRARAEADRADSRDRRDNEFFELRTERDHLQRRNQELEHRVEALEQKLEMLVRKLEETERRVIKELKEKD